MQRIKIKGMSCQHCVQAVTKALQEVPGVKNVQVSLEDGEARFEEAAEVDMQEVKYEVEKAGYSVEE
jgi:copper chaperone CopZ